MSDGISFIRKNGRVIPIRASGGGGGHAKAFAKAAKGPLAKAGHFARAAAIGAGVSQVAEHGMGSKAIKVNNKMDLLGLGASIASGAAGALLFNTPKKLAAGFIATHALDAAGIAANVASVSGKGKKIERTKQAAKQEARNFVAGNAVYLAGIVGIKSNRDAAKSALKKAPAAAEEALAIARSALRVGPVGKVAIAAGALAGGAAYLAFRKPKPAKK